MKWRPVGPWSPWAPWAASEMAPRGPLGRPLKWRPVGPLGPWAPKSKSIAMGANNFETLPKKLLFDIFGSKMIAVPFTNPMPRLSEHCSSRADLVLTPG